jgi:hypothetical protein
VGRTPLAPNFLSRGLTRLSIDINYDDFGALLGEEFGCGLTNARTCARNNRYFVFQPHEKIPQLSWNFFLGEKALVPLVNR